MIDSPDPIGGGAFGWGISSADFTGDGKPDLLVAQSQTGPGSVFVFDGATGRNIDRINPPEKNTPGTSGIAPDEGLSFVYVETMPDIGSCPGGDGPDDDKICDASVIGPGDGIPEILAGSRSLKVNQDNNFDPPATGARQLGRGYVIDGRTRAVLKRIDMPLADRAAQYARNTPNGPAAPQFARVMSSPQAMAPCAGLASEDNNVGVGPCPFTPPGVRIGDLDGGGQPDIVITARSYLETAGPGNPSANPPVPAGSAAPGSECRQLATGGTCSAGKAWAYSGELIAGSNPRTILDTAMFEVQNPDAQGGNGRTAGSTEFGGNLFRLGDVNGDGKPEFVIPSRNADYPLSNPDAGFRDVGAAYLINAARIERTPPGATPLATPGQLLSTYLHPNIQARTQFSGNFNSGRAAGDLGSNSLPDLMLPSALQNVTKTDEGEVYVFNGEPTGAGGGGQGSFNFATLHDPEPKIGGNFGGGISGAGDLVGGIENPANEAIVGGFRFDPFTEATQNVVGSVHVMNPQTERVLQTIRDPDEARGSGFGVGITPMGDLNDDGFMDLAVSSYLFNGVVGGQGRAYIFRSDNSPLPIPAPPPAAAPAAQAPAPAAAPAGAPVVPAALLPGSCKNAKRGTAGNDRVRGTLAGDQLLALAGNDLVEGLQSADCLDGGTGNDRLDGGADNDRLIGQTGDDRLNGDAGADRLFGGDGRDKLVGGFGRDLLAGGAGNDVLSGGSDRDELFGEGGNDVLRAGDGRNLLDGGSGNDHLEARNGERDDVRCGRGRDRAVVDRVDRVSGCESISRTRRKR